MVCNLLTAVNCNGFYTFFMIWVALALVVLIGALAKRWLGEEEVIPFPYNWFGSLLAVPVWMIVGSLSGNFKLTFISCLVALFVGGYGLGIIMGGTE